MPIVDWDRFNELRTDIGEEDFADVAKLFVAELQEKLDSMSSETAEASDFHFLRGSAANLGFEALVQACAAAEAACTAGTLPDVDAVRAAYDGAIAEVSPHLPELVAA